jgi:hypothetical protein
MKLIKRYNSYLQKIVKAKTKPEPWMHLLVVPVSSAGRLNFVWCIYIWDTRQVLEQGKGSISDYKYFKNAPDALDNREPLKGISNDDQLQKAMAHKAAPYVDKPKVEEPDNAELGFERHKGMAIMRYTERVRSILRTKTKGAAYLHIVFFRVHTKNKAYYAIYVWDKRTILEEGWCTEDQMDDAYKVSDYANDNHKLLHGDSEGARRFNYSVSRV